MVKRDFQMLNMFSEMSFVIVKIIRLQLLGVVNFSFLDISTAFCF